METDTDPVTVATDTAIDLLREMLRIRRFEEAAEAASDEGDIPGFLHLCRGHEGSHAGMCGAMDTDDWLAVGGARLHGQYLAKGLPMDEVMAELFGKETGSNGGKGGSMHVSDVDRHLYGHAATIGSGLNPAVGLALAQQQRETGSVVVCTVGDGGTSRGSFHTALVFAAYWNLPVVFVIENNEWAISTPAEALPPEQLSDYGDPHTMPTETIDGTDVERVYEAVSDAVERARNGEGPSVIESRVHRLVGHFGGDKETYRSEEERERIREEGDPLENYRERLLADGVLTDDEYEDLDAEIRTEAEEAVAFARESEYPDPQTAYDDLYQRPLYGQGGEDA
ncbi:thiamine pyrophosphate-dependent dehydrogenase E1 component subunit alpha [Halorientalis marina]|uniref:thiamine pyrophosphate-dependent dehydrogenase E1 component subunit alpha n=1 Tax=Halorientalis marina TaxID=2931976 RepID=UPI001FF5C89F|nr:thiamine pyrophosphate-dependent dehydrogenase E1 component subunit alpha [Halorientalis marina]